MCMFFFFSSRRRHTRLQGDWSSDVCSSDLAPKLSFASSTAPAACRRFTTAASSLGTRFRYGSAPYVVGIPAVDRKSTRLNSSHLVISYAVFCLKKKNKRTRIVCEQCYHTNT